MFLPAGLQHLFSLCVVHLDSPVEIDGCIIAFPCLRPTLAFPALKHRAPAAGAGRLPGGLLRDSSAVFARFAFSETLSDCVAGSLAAPFGLPTFLRFARFRIVGISLSVIGLQVRRETAQIAKGWPSFRSSLPRSRSFLIRDRQQSGIVAKLGITGEQNCTAAVSAAGGVTVGRVLPALASACRRDGGSTANAAIPSPTLRQYQQSTHDP